MKSKKLCDFSSSSSACQYITDRDKPNQWQLETKVCRGRKLSIYRRKAIPAIRLRNSTFGDQRLAYIINNFQSARNRTLPRPKYARSSASAVSLCPKGMKTRSAILKLDPAPTVKRATGRRIIDGTLEIGLLRITHARYIKFKVQAPPNAVAYLLEVTSHCVPDPPGHLSLVATIYPSSHSAVERDFCIKMHGKVRRCSDFFVRLRLLVLVSEEPEGEIRLTNKGTSQSMCQGMMMISEDSGI